MIRAPLTCALAAGLTVALAPACGKKGPPLAPLSNRPRAPEAVTARLQGDRVVVRFTIPRANQSGVQPANIERVDVYALTGPKLPAARFLEHAAVVATVPVRRPPPPDAPDPPDPARPPAAARGADAAQVTGAGPDSLTALDQGAPAVVVELLTPQAFEPVVVDEKPQTDPRGPRATSVVVIRRTPLTPPDLGTPVKPPPVRYYAAAGVNRSGRRGSLSTVVAVPLGSPPLPPSQPTAQVRERSVELTWEPPAGLRGAASPAASADPAESPAPDGTPASPRADVVLPSRSLAPWPAVTAGYNVYVVPPPGVERAPASPFAVSSLAELLNPTPLTEPKFSDPRAEFGTERCYVVRAVEMAGTTATESGPSPVRCAKVVDVFPPAVPTSLAAIAGEGSVNLIWEASGDADLGGYLVFRSDRSDGPLEPLVTDPIRETTWRDGNVTPGVRYRYAVAAVDRSSPPNRSALSQEVQVTPR